MSVPSSCNGKDKKQLLKKHVKLLENKLDQLEGKSSNLEASNLSNLENLIDPSLKLLGYWGSGSDSESSLETNVSYSDFINHLEKVAHLKQ